MACGQIGLERGQREGGPRPYLRREPLVARADLELPMQQQAAERDAYYEEELNAREVEQEGQVVNEFYVRILSYPRCE